MNQLSLLESRANGANGANAASWKLLQRGSAVGVGAMNTAAPRPFFPGEHVRLPSANVVELLRLVPSGTITWLCRYMYVVERTFATRVGGEVPLQEQWLRKFGMPA